MRRRHAIESVGQEKDIVAQASQAQLVELPGADHVFSDAGTQPMIDAVVAWVSERWPAA